MTGEKNYEMIGKDIPIYCPTCKCSHLSGSHNKQDTVMADRKHDEFPERIWLTPQGEAIFIGISGIDFSEAGLTEYVRPHKTLTSDKTLTPEQVETVRRALEVLLDMRKNPEGVSYEGVKAAIEKAEQALAILPHGEKK